MLAASKNGESGDNQTALALASLESQAVAAMKGTSLKDSYQQMINGVAGDVATAKSTAEAATAIKDTLSGQREALSGVSLDEEAINLVRQQRHLPRRCPLHLSRRRHDENPLKHHMIHLNPEP